MRPRAMTVARGFAPRQRGAVMVLFVIALVAIIGMAGLALDGSHAMLNKTRLQNTVDAAALSAAKTLDDTGDVVLAEAEAFAMFANNAAVAGHDEIAAAYADGSLTVTVQFSAELNPFVSGSSPAAYVRVRAQNLVMPSWLSGIVGVNQKRVSASAVAGPSPTILEACNIMPLMVCGDPDAEDDYFGYTPNEAVVLKSGSSQDGWDVGTGNFQLIRLGDNTGGADIRDALAGNFDVCMGPGDPIETEPGNTVGPVAQGLNTRFGVHNGPMTGMESTYPPDVVIEQPDPPLDYNPDLDDPAAGTSGVTWGGTAVENLDDTTGYYFDHADYNTRIAPPGNYDVPPPDGDFNRREVAVAVGDCTNTINGQGQVPLLGFGCFFLLQQVEQSGQGNNIFGEFITDCRSGGQPGPDPTNIPGPYIIQLYRDFGSTDS
jgi:Flp pilus assembly protein TadG